jgi:hypothetical protein
MKNADAGSKLAQYGVWKALQSEPLCDYQRISGWVTLSGLLGLRHPSR